MAPTKEVLLVCPPKSKKGHTTFIRKVEILYLKFHFLKNIWVVFLSLSLQKPQCDFEKKETRKRVKLLGMGFVH